MANFFKKLFGGGKETSEQTKETSQTQSSFRRDDFVREPKIEERYYFYDNRCSFILSKDDILFSKVENDGRKHGFMTKTMGFVSIEILLDEPTFACTRDPVMVNALNIELFKPQKTVNGYPYIMEKHTSIGIIRCYINCGGFWVQVDVDKNIDLFLNSFRLER